MLSRRWDALLDDIRALDPAGGLDGIIIEITEQDSIADYDRMRQKIEAIRSLRGFIAVDDTGSGFASLKQSQAVGHAITVRHDAARLDRVQLKKSRN